MYGLYEDTRTRFLREGIEIGAVESMVRCCKTAMEDKGLTIDEAIECVCVPPEYVDQVKAAIISGQ